MRKASHRKNGAAGFKAVIVYDSGRTYQPVAKNFATAQEAREYAQRWIDVNDAPPPSPEQAEATRNARADAFLAAWNKAAR